MLLVVVVAVAVAAVAVDISRRNQCLRGDCCPLGCF